MTAAGSSERFGSGKKELFRVDGRSVLDRSLSPFLKLPELEALVITAPAGRELELEAAIHPESLAALARLGPGRFAVVAGGQSRRDSVRNGLETLARMIAPDDAPLPALDDIVVLVHDGARPWARPELAIRVAESASRHGAALPVLPLVDTPKELGPDGSVTGHPKRSSFGAAQTPQGFGLGTLLSAHRRAASEGVDCTDDAELWGRYVGPVASVPGEAANRKVTFAGDLDEDAAGDRRNSCAFRIGQGWDLHRLVQGRALLIGGVAVPSELGEDAHSDGDVLLHAVVDALLGAAALGDIGSHFPPSDERWRGADSADLARRAAALVRDAGWEIGNIDCTVVLEAPRLGPFRSAIAERVAACLGISSGEVSVKAKTKEGVDAVGMGAAVEAMAIAALFRRR